MRCHKKFTEITITVYGTSVKQYAELSGSVLFAYVCVDTCLFFIIMSFYYPASPPLTFKQLWIVSAGTRSQ